ncbi:MAG: polysaccharide deacetylase family protein [Bacillota bacterium]
MLASPVVSVPVWSALAVGFGTWVQGGVVWLRGGMSHVTDSRAEIPVHTRRAVLAAGAGWLLCSCGAPLSTPRSAVSSSGPRVVTSRPQPSLSTVPSSQAPIHVLTRAQAIAKYGSQRPREWGMTVTGTVLSLGAKAVAENAIALTFDACGGPTAYSAGCGYDARLIDFLRSRRAKATLFLNHRWIRANPEIAAELAADPLFEIGNHGRLHRPLSVSGQMAYGEHGTRNVGEAYDEVAGNMATLMRLTGHEPRWFRAGTAHCDEVAVRMVGDMGQRVVNFTVNGDFGTTATVGQVVSQLATVKAGDIVISHMNRPEHDTAAGYRAGLDAVLSKGLRTVTLSEYLA